MRSKTIKPIASGTTKVNTLCITFYEANLCGAFIINF